LPLNKFLISLLAITILSSILILPLVNSETGKKLAPFVDPTRDPQSYVSRYQNEPKFKEWYDKNYGSSYKSIYEAVGLPEPTTKSQSTPASESKPNYVQLYKDKDYGFAFDLSKKWVFDESQESIITLYHTEIQSGAIVPMVTLEFKPIPPESSSILNCDTYATIILESEIPNTKLVKCKTESITGGSKTILNSVQKVPFEEKYYKQKRIIVNYLYDNGDSYNMIFYSDAKDYQKVVKDFDNLQKSFVTFTASQE